MISNERAKYVFNGNGITKTFQIPFDFFQNTAGGAFGKNNQVSVFLVSTDGATRGLTEDTDYEVQTTPPSDESSGFAGYVKVFTAPAIGEKLVVLRDVALTQELRLTEDKPIPVKELEASLDKFTMALQELREKMKRAICYGPETNTADMNAQEYIKNLQDVFTQGESAVETAVQNAVETCQSCRTDAQRAANQTASDLQGVSQRVGTVINYATEAERSKNLAQAAAADALDSKGAAESAADTSAGYATAASSSAEEAAECLEKIMLREQKVFEYTAGTARGLYDGSLTVFKTGVDLSEKAVTVFVNGILQPSGSYTKTTQGITFASAVASGDKVAVVCSGAFRSDSSDAQIYVNTHNTDPNAHADIRQAISAKQDALTAGTGISIEGNVISATGGGSGGSGTVCSYSFSLNNYTKQQFSNGSDNSTWQSGSIMGVASKIIKAEMQVGIPRTVSGTNYTAWSAFPATAFIYMRNTTAYSTNISYNVAWTSAAVSNWATNNGVFKALSDSDSVSTRLVVYFEKA